ncbi:MAG TPA: LptE family protein [Candidatus Acidoferrales bacterium]|nr:LptE family protein [Candidatus Acidoferrales bacterium]
MLTAAALCVCLMTGCGYHVVGRNSALPSSWHTLAIPIFVNRTPTYRIEQTVTNAVIHEFLTRTKYRIVPRAEGADAVLRGEITDIQAVPLLFDASSGHVNTMLVTVKLKVALNDQQSQKTVYRNDNFVFRNEYQVSSDVNHFFQEEGPAMQRMSLDFASDLVARLLEGL